MAAFLRKYGTGTGSNIIIPIVKAGSDDFAVAADWTPVAGDVKISKDGGGSANIGTLPVFLTDIGWKFVFSDAELQCARLNVNIVDSPTKVIKDQHIVINTYGNASAQFQVDLSDGVRAGLTALPNAVPAGVGGLPTVNASNQVAGVSGNVVGSVASVTGNVGGNVTGSVGSVVGNVGGNVTGTVASVVGAVGSVTGNVGGNVVGSVASVANITVSGGIVESNLKQIDGQATSGNNATLNLKKLNIVNSAGDAIVATSTGSDGHGAIFTGYGNGQGLRANGGASGAGLNCQGGSSGSAGAIFAANGTDPCTEYHGIFARGTCMGSGIRTIAQNDGHGIFAQGGSDSGDGFHAEAQGVGDGIEAVGAGGGYDINADIQGNLSGSVASVVSAVSADVVSVSGDATAADNLESDYDGTGYTKANSTIGTCTTNTDMRGTNGANTVVPDVAGTAATLIGTAGANLTDLGGMSTAMKAEVQAEAEDAIDAKINTTAGVIDNVALVDVTTTNSDMRGTDGANTVVPDAAGTAAALHVITDGKVDAIDTTIGVAGAGLTDLGGMSTGMKAQVNTEVNDVINVDAKTESLGVPGKDAALGDKINYLFSPARNGGSHNRTTGIMSVNNDAGAPIATCTASDTGGSTGTFTRGKMA